MLKGIINRNIDAYVSHKRLLKGTEVVVTEYQSPAYYAIEFEKSIYLVPKYAVTLKKEKRK